MIGMVLLIFDAIFVERLYQISDDQQSRSVRPLRGAYLIPPALVVVADLSAAMPDRSPVQRNDAYSLAL